MHFLIQFHKFRRQYTFFILQNRKRHFTHIRVIKHPSESRHITLLLCWNVQSAASDEFIWRAKSKSRATISSARTNGFGDVFLSIRLFVFIGVECFVFIDSILRLWWFDWWRGANWIDERHWQGGRMQQLGQIGKMANCWRNRGIRKCAYVSRNFFHYFSVWSVSEIIELEV